MAMGAVILLLLAVVGWLFLRPATAAACARVKASSPCSRGRRARA